MANPTMQAYRLLEWGAGGRFTDIEVPQAGPNDVLVKMAAVGLCRQRHRPAGLTTRLMAVRTGLYARP
jgi:hypothetical protein